MTSTDPSLQDFDASLLAELEQSLPRQDFRSFIEDYLKSSDERLQRAESLGARGDLPALASEAHILISTAGSYGSRRASALARELEAACKAANAGQAASLLRELAASSRRAWTAMRERFLAAGE
jgi:HPt (histidine-containing phosphotransfer) domain-containing protein